VIVCYFYVLTASYCWYWIHSPEVGILAKGSDDRSWDYGQFVERNPPTAKAKADQAALELVEALRKRGIGDADVHQALSTLTKRILEDREFAEGLLYYIRNWRLLTRITVRT